MPKIPGYSDVTWLGRGGFSTVYRATQDAFGRPVAIKVLDLGLDDAGRRRFARECLATGMVSQHPNVVTVYDAGDTPEGHPYLVLEYIAGGSLGELVKANGPMEPDRAARIGSAIASALASAHTAGVLHRDVKPANVLLDPDGTPKLADFGISWISSDPRYAGGSTRSYSPEHVAPEQFAGLDVTTAADVYALASMVFYLAEGRAPHSSDANENMHALLARKASGSGPTWGQRIPADLRALLEPALAQDPSTRPTASDLSEALAVYATTASAPTSNHALQPDATVLRESTSAALPIQPSSTVPLAAEGLEDLTQALTDDQVPTPGQAPAQEDMSSPGFSFQSSAAGSPDSSAQALGARRSSGPLPWVIASVVVALVGVLAVAMIASSSDDDQVRDALETMAGSTIPERDVTCVAETLEWWLGTETALGTISRGPAAVDTVLDSVAEAPFTNRRQTVQGKLSPTCQRFNGFRLDDGILVPL